MRKKFFKMMKIILIVGIIIGSYLGIDQIETRASDTEISPMMHCVDCGRRTYIHCLKNRTYAYTYPCSDRCKVDVYVSSAQDMCTECGKVIMYYDRHECLEVHSTCSKGYNVICLFTPEY